MRVACSSVLSSVPSADRQLAHRRTSHRPLVNAFLQVLSLLAYYA